MENIERINEMSNVTKGFVEKEMEIDLKKKTPGNLKQINVIMRTNLQDLIRSRKFFILLSIVLGLSFILILVIGKIILMWGQLSLSIILFSAIFFGADAIAGEFQNKTGYFIIPNPIRRSSIFLGKFLSAFIASSIVLGIMIAIVYTSGLYYSDIPSGFWISVLFAWFFLASVLGCVFLFSTLSKSIMISFFLSIIVLAWVNTMVVDTAGYIPIEPWFILNYGASIIADVLISPYPIQKTIGPNPFYPKMGGMTTIVYNPSIPEGLIIIALYFVISIILGLLIFERREF